MDAAWKGVAKCFLAERFKKQGTFFPLRILPHVRKQQCFVFSWRGSPALFWVIWGRGAMELLSGRKVRVLLTHCPSHCMSPAGEAALPPQESCFSWAYKLPSCPAWGIDRCCHFQWSHGLFFVEEPQFHASSCSSAVTLRRGGRSFTPTALLTTSLIAFPCRCIAPMFSLLLPPQKHDPAYRDVFPAGANLICTSFMWRSVKLRELNMYSSF